MTRRWAMPNPDFTGTVPRMRCETCKHWSRYSSDLPFGACAVSGSFVTHGNLTAASRWPITTTDLTVCSNWSKNDNAGDDV